MKIKSIKLVKKLENKKVIVRCDFDVPLGELKVKSGKLKVLDDTRLKACIPTINFLLEKNVEQIILIGHMGRPGGKVVKKLSFRPVVKYLAQELKQEIGFVEIDRYISKEMQDSLEKIDSKIVVLENLRFSDREQKNCKKFAKNLASLGDIYINEAFAVSHRSTSSVDVIQNYLPSYAGLHLEKEIKNLTLKKVKPLTVIIGGAKIETKLPIIQNFLKKADTILIGGGVANTFLKVQGMDIKKSLVDDNYLKDAKRILKSKGNVYLPGDFVWQKNKILDIGKETIKEYSDIIKKSKVIVWNGPMGYLEDKKFAKGTKKILEAIFNNKKAQVVIGGGDTLTIIKKQLTKDNKNIFISTGGGAMLDFLAGKKLPGLKKIYK